MKNYCCWHWKRGSEYPSELVNLWLVWDFPAWSVCKKIRYCCFSHSAPVASDVRGSVHETPLFPHRVCGFLLPILSCSVFLFEPCHPVVESQRECTVCAHVCLSACNHINACVPGLLFFFTGAGSTVVHICTLRQCGALWFPAPQLLIFFFLLLFILLYSILPLPTTALIPLYCPFFVYFIEDVWLNILRLAVSRYVLVSVDHYAREKTSSVLNTFE